MNEKYVTDGMRILEELVELSHIAPELCPSCKYLETESFGGNKEEKWCRKTATEVIRVWLCTMYERDDESETD